MLFQSYTAILVKRYESIISLNAKALIVNQNDISDLSFLITDIQQFWVIITHSKYFSYLYKIGG
jgi:hypothetical protein